MTQKVEICFAYFNSPNPGWLGSKISSGERREQNIFQGHALQIPGNALLDKKNIILFILQLHYCLTFDQKIYKIDLQSYSKRHRRFDKWSLWLAIFLPVT